MSEETKLSKILEEFPDEENDDTQLAKKWQWAKDKIEIKPLARQLEMYKAIADGIIGYCNDKPAVRSGVFTSMKLMLKEIGIK